MRGKTIKFGLKSLIFMFSGLSFADTGSLVTLTQSGVMITPTVISVCLNALDSNKPLSCQKYTISQATFTVTPAKTGKDYLYAGVKVLQGLNYTFNTVGSHCTQGSGDYCLFVVSHAHPKTLNISSTIIAVGKPRDGGVIACLADEECIRNEEGGSSHCSNKNLIASGSDNQDAMRQNTMPWSQTIDRLVTDNDDPYVNGKRNTDTAYIQNSNGPSAIQVCHDLQIGDQSDWYLPARNELGCLYNNNIDIGGFNINSSYWSSSEFDATHVWSQDFSDGSQYHAKKNVMGYRTRCVRVFTP